MGFDGALDRELVRSRSVCVKLACLLDTRGQAGNSGLRLEQGVRLRLGYRVV